MPTNTQKHYNYFTEYTSIHCLQKFIKNAKHLDCINLSLNEITSLKFLRYTTIDNLCVKLY
jgi:hypothetical protein